MHSIHNIALYPMQSKQTSKKSDWPPSPWQESNFMQSCLILSPYFSVYKSPDQFYIYWVEMGSVERCNDKYHRHNESQFELKCSVCPPVLLMVIMGTTFKDPPNFWSVYIFFRSGRVVFGGRLHSRSGRPF